MEQLKIFFIAGSFLISVLALMFTRRSWVESNRPIVTALIETNSAGNMAISYNLAVHNCGNRPAVEIRLIADKREIESIFAEGIDEGSKLSIIKCFTEDGIIPVLHHQNTVKNSFGSTSGGKNADHLKYGAKLNICITYKDLSGRAYKEKVPLIVKDSSSFAGSMWASSGA